MSKPKEGAAFLQPDGTELKQMEVGNLPVTAGDQYGKKLDNFTLTNVKFVEKQKFNLFSTSKLVDEGWTPGGNRQAITFAKDGRILKFDIKIATASGCLFAICLTRREVGDAALAAVQKMTVLQAHQRLGHCNEDTTRQAAKLLGWELQRGPLGVCEACSVAKAKQKNVPKDSPRITAERPNQRIYLDLALIKSMEGMPKPTKAIWEILVDELTGFKKSLFHITKDGMVEPTCSYFNQEMLAGRPVDFIRCDNAGENNLLQNRATGVAWKLKLTFEYTARGTPQQKHLAELAFATLANKGRAMMYAANLTLELRYRLYREAFQTATLLDGLLPVEINGVVKSRYNHWSGGHEPKFAKRTWGEAGTVKLTSLATTKLEDWGVPCMFVGYATDHDGNVYRTWDPRTGRIHETRDIIWLRRMFFTKKPNDDAEEIDFNFVVPAPVYREGVVTAPDLGAGEGGNAEGAGGDAEDAPAVEAEEAVAVPVEAPAATAENEEETVEEVATTRSGRAVRPPARFREAEFEGMNVDGSITLSEAEVRYHDAMREIYELSLLSVERSEIHERARVDTSFVGMGIGGGFENTQELRVLKYDEAIASADKESGLRRLTRSTIV
jgi:hypothetical protein